MKKKIVISILGLFVLMLIVNIILSLITSFLPVKFIMPDALVEPPHYYNFVLGKYNLSLSQTVLNTWAIMVLIIVLVKLGVKNISVTNPSKMQIILEEYYHFIENTFLVTFGKYKKKFMPFFSALFAFVLFSNLSLFLFPFIVTVTKKPEGYVVGHFFRTPTADPISRYKKRWSAGLYKKPYASCMVYASYKHCRGNIKNIEHFNEIIWKYVSRTCNRRTFI